MSRRVLSRLLGLCVMLTPVLAMSQTVVQRFSGSLPGRTAPFDVDGPWLLNWRVGSEFPMLAYVEIDLYDAATGRFVGVALQHTGTGSGEKIIRQGGRYRAVVTGQSADWSIEIVQAPENLAAFLDKHPDLTELRFVRPDTGLSRELVGRITRWRVSDDEKTLLLETEDAGTIKVGFFGDVGCPGLKSSQNIYFVSAGIRADMFNAILLEDGRRCYLDTTVR